MRKGRWEMVLPFIKDEHNSSSIVVILYCVRSTPWLSTRQQGGIYEFVLCTTDTNNNDFVVIEILIKPEGKVFRKIISLLIYKSLVNLSRAKATASIIETAQQRNY